MSFAHGTKAKLSINAVDVSCYLKEGGMDQSIDTAEVTTLCSTGKEYIPGLKDGTISLDGMFDPTMDAAVASAMATGLVAFVYQPQGATTGLPKYSGNCFYNKYTLKTGTGDAGTFTAAAQITAGWTRAVNP
jgi:hypothetical protein